MLNRIVRVFGGDPNKRQIDEFTETVDYINSLEPKYEAFSDEQLFSMTAEFRLRLAQGETLDELLPETFAVVRETSKRTLGQRHYDVQLIGGISLHSGIIAEMRTGEGKTLVATLPLYLNALQLNPKLTGRIKLRFSIPPSGRATSVEVTSQNIGDATLKSCIKRKVQRWRFGDIGAGAVAKVTYPLLLKTSQTWVRKR